MQKWVKDKMAAASVGTPRREKHTRTPNQQEGGNMKTHKSLTALGIAATMGISIAAGPAAMAQDDRQKDKNTMRNVGTGLGAAAGAEWLAGSAR
jgi:hypothetical protein